MKTFQNLYEEVQSFAGDSSTSATTKHKARINDTYHELLRRFNRRVETTADTVASQQSYELPADLNKLTSVKVTVSSIDYPLEEVVNEDEWNLLNDQGSAYTSDISTHFYLKDNNILLYPYPANDGDTITYYYTRKDKDMSADNYTTGNITTLANEGTAVTGSGTTWTAAMVGRFFKVNSDGYWYKISARTDNTHITLEKAYQGTAISGGSENYTIAEVPLLPEEYQLALVYKPCWLYFLSKRNSAMAFNFKALYDEIVRSMRAEEDTTTSIVIKKGEGEVKNINDYPRI